MTLVELMVALVVLALGVLAVGRLFPSSAKSQNNDRQMTGASNFAQQKLEELSALNWTDAAMLDGTYPTGGGADTLGNGGWQRTYTVLTLASPLDNIKRVIVTVTWTNGQARSLSDTLYVRK